MMKEKQNNKSKQKMKKNMRDKRYVLSIADEDGQ